MAWSDAAAGYLRGSTSCPRCERGPVGREHCPFCGAILVGEVADELRAVSAEAAELLTRRQQLIGRLTTQASLAAPPIGAPAPSSAAPLSGPSSAAPPSSRPNSTVSLQSVLAVSAAALIAIAVLVFRFSNTGAELSIRQLVIAGVTIVFLGFAWLLARMRLTFSAEAVGVVAMVFLALDVWAVSENRPNSVSPWASAAVSTLVAAMITLLIAAVVRLRTWLWSGLLALVLVPAFFGYALDGPWSAVGGHVAAVAVALLGFEVAKRMSPRFENPLRAERVTVVTAAAAFGALAILGVASVPVPDGSARVLSTSLVLAMLAGLAALATRTLASAAWSAALGVLAASAVGILPLALRLGDETWHIVAIPLATAVAVATVAFAPWAATVARTPLRVGALIVALGSALPALVVGLLQLATPFASRFGGGRWLDEPGAGQFWLEPMGRAASLFPATTSLAAILGIVAVTVGVLALALAVRRDGGVWRPWLGLAAWLGAAALLTAPGWSGLSRPGQVVAGIAIAFAIGVATSRIPRIRSAAASLRLPPLLAAHGILIHLVAISWGDERLTVAAGAAVVVALGVLAMSLPAAVRPIYVAAGYAYALVIVARGLDLLGVDAIPVLSYTTTLASVFALVITLVRRVRPPLWYAVLGVTAVPFVIGVATVIAERTWETALANTAIFALSFTLTLTRRPGLTRIVRSGAAALLLPSLAVVVVNVVPRIIETNLVPAWNGAGGAPVTLPVIATLVALVLPTTPLVAGWLRRGDIPESDAASARLWIEVSAFVTGGLAALLSLVLETPDLGTALVVFLILGIGAASASIFAQRRHGWWVAAGCWTAALWCVWGLAGITDVEPYVYPPALAAVVIGVVLTLRRRDGAALVAPGLAIAIATSLVVLTITGSGPTAYLPWRALALLAASLVLLVVGSALGRAVDTSRLAVLRVPALVSSIGAAAAGAIQAVRYATERDDLGLARADDVIWPVLAFSVTAAVLAASAARALRPPHRWLQTPALVYLVVGPIAAVAAGAPMWMLWALTLVLLGIMLVTVLAALRGPTIMPPTWLVFAAAWCTAVAGWSVRDLNVEWFSLPLGLALLGAGVLVLRHGLAGSGSARSGATGPGATGPGAPGAVAGARGALASWPVGFTRSWLVLAPGVVVIVLPSVLATGTNPATWRAILVIGLALVALLVGAIGRYAAPFVLSLVTFGVEFAIILVQLAAGREIDPVVIWVASLTAGAILLFVAIWFERRSRAGADGARMRDLR